MPRHARCVFPGVPHHVTQRGHRRGEVFFSPADRRTYLAWLREYTAANQVDVLAYCLMPNHVHLVLVPADEHGLLHSLKPLHMRYAQHVNRLRRWKGHLWQGRYFSSALDESHLWAAIRYVERNPVRAGMCAAAEEYEWSSAAAHCGLRSDPVLVSKADWNRRVVAIGDWSAWLAAADPESVTDQLRRNTAQGLPCGSPDFVQRLERDAGRRLRAGRAGRPRREDHSAAPRAGAGESGNVPD
jgi:putative transposase